MTYRHETLFQLLERVKAEAWPDAEIGDLVRIEPIGSRNDALVLNRTSGRVMTGTRTLTGPHACFEGSLDEFAAAVETKYVPIKDAGLTRWSRSGQDYRAAIKFFRSLLEEIE